jgi:hypothetical protein
MAFFFPTATIDTTLVILFLGYFLASQFVVIASFRVFICFFVHTPITDTVWDNDFIGFFLANQTRVTLFVIFFPAPRIKDHAVIIESTKFKTNGASVKYHPLPAVETH